MIGALLSNAPVNLLKNSGVAGVSEPGAEDVSSGRRGDSARAIPAAPEAEAVRAGGVPVLTSEAVLALQKADAQEETSNRDRPDDGADEGTGEDAADGAGTGQSTVSGGGVAETAAQAGEDPEKEEDPDGDGLNEAEEKQVEKLAQRDREVRAHEQAHARVGGAYASAPSYTFQQGPDGKRYAIGGEVQIDTAKERTPEATIRKMQIVIRAATAPAEPSSQDLKVAQQARSQLSEAQAELRQQKAEELNGDDADEVGDPGPAEASDAGASSTSADPEKGSDDRETDPASAETAQGNGNEEAIAAYRSALERANDAQSIFSALVT